MDAKTEVIEPEQEKEEGSMGDIQSVMTYIEPIKIGKLKVGWLFKRTDYFEDGSASDFKGIELTNDMFDFLVEKAKEAKEKKQYNGGKD